MSKATTESKPTPGPWHIRRQDDKTGFRGISIAAGDLYVANMVMQLRDNEMANARLIASAPDLLAAAKKALKLISTPEIRWPGTLSIVAKDIREQLVEAIAQAEGTNP